MTAEHSTTAVTTETVLAAVKKLPIESFTTFEIAEDMGVPEYPVRAAVSWLLKGGVIERSGARKRYTATGNEPYFATTYVLKQKAAPADFSALMGIFCRG